VDVVAERQHTVVGPERAQPGLPQGSQAELQHQAAQEQQQPYSVTPAEAEKPKEKKGIFRKLLGVFK
jgi:hypothetical protein